MHRRMPCQYLRERRYLVGNINAGTTCRRQVNELNKHPPAPRLRNVLGLMCKAGAAPADVLLSMHISTACNFCKCFLMLIHIVSDIYILHILPLHIYEKIDTGGTPSWKYIRLGNPIFKGIKF